MTARSHVRAFPFASIESLTRADIEAEARLRRIARALVRTEAIESTLSELLDERVQVFVRRYRRLEAAHGSDGAVGVLVAPSADPSPPHRVLVEIEGALAATVVTRALRRKAPRIADSATDPAPALCGATAAVLSALLRRAHSAFSLKVLAAGPASALRRDLLQLEPDVTAAWLTVVVGADAFEARVGVSERAIVMPAPEPFTENELLRLGDAPIAIPLLISTALTTRAELTALSKGDIFVFGKSSVAARNDGCLLGEVSLVPDRGEHGVAADLAEGGRLVIRGLLESHPWEKPMSSISSGKPTIEVLEHAPVVVRVELGTVEMKAREWAALGPGDVVSLGRKVGDHAILRVGGVEVARGELVQVDGEYGVRIVGIRENEATA